MNGEKEEVIMQKKDMGSLCKEHLHRYVLVQLQNGESYDGIVEYVDEENVYLAVPTGDGTGISFSSQSHQMHPHIGQTPYAAPQGTPHTRSHGIEEEEATPVSQDERQFGPFGYGAGYGYGPGYYGPGYGYPSYGYGYPRPRPRPNRFQRLILPLASLVALSTLPYY